MRAISALPFGNASGKLLAGFQIDTLPTPRLNEQLTYTFDPAGNLNYRTNNTLIQNFQVNSVNELTTNTNGGTLTVVGTTTSPAASVTVNGINASNYSDATFAATNLALTTTYTAIANDSYGRSSTSTVNVNISTNVGFQYDGNGNLTNDGLRNFVYDDENELIQVSISNQWMSQFSYDGKMRRRIRNEFAWQGSWVQTNQVEYVYDGNLVIQERDINNLPTVTYTRGKDLSGSLGGAGGIGGLLARTAQAYADAPLAGHSFYHCDGNGNITMLIDSSQGIVARYLYDAFGNTISASGLLANANVYRFSSKEWHQNSGLAYYGYRYYDPNLQRWLNRDPIGESGFDTLRRRDDSADTHEANSYEFVHNDPVDKLDPNGLFIWLCTRHVAGFPFVGTHAYLWDDTTKTSCGMRGSFGLGPTSGSQDTGPGTAGQSCQKVGGSAGLESGIMACCKGTANYGLWRPFQNDCHNAAERCLTGAGLNPPLNPRFGPPPGF